MANKFAFVPASVMRQVVGVTDAATASFRHFWDECRPQRDESGNSVYPHKQSLCSYYDVHSQRRSGLDSSIEHIDPTTAHEVSNFRVHRGWPASADGHQNLVNLRQAVFSLLRSPALGSADPDAYDAMQTAYRVTKSATADGDPGPEGIHQDSAELTVVVLIGRENVSAESGCNRVWSLEQPCGKPSESDLQSERLLLQTTLTEPLDALLVLDRQVKHEASAITPANILQPAVRDVLTFEVRQKQPRS